ncbi:MAG: S8 family serine peptidase, partial [Acidobacteria bacterium]|nr:S8 family serine peptidase [Acidobacteriota bacterium]
TRRLLRLAAITAAALAMPILLSVPPAYGDAGKKISKGLERRLQEVAPDDQVRVIVQTLLAPSSIHYGRLHRRGGAVRRLHTSIQGYAATLPAAQISAFAEDPEIERVSLDAPVSAHLDVARMSVNAGSNFVTDSGFTGRGVGVAIIDTGVSGHADLVRTKSGARLYEVEIVGSEAGVADYYGHGTHVAGILAGSGKLSSDRHSFRTFAGVAPGADIISLRALYPDGSGFTSDVIAAIDWVVAHKNDYNIRVLTLALGHPIFESYRTDPLCRAVRAATDAGILTVVAAGNEGAIGSGFGTITSPGNEPTAITVGAMDDDGTAAITDDVLAWYSSRGPSLIDHIVKPDIVAPGTWIVSTRAYGSYLDTEYHSLTLLRDEYKDEPGKAVKDGDYFVLSGTSMATPMVAGAAALMLEKEPDLGPGDLKARLMASARKDDYLIFETGAGYLDVEAALQASGHATFTPSPYAFVQADGSVTIEDTGLIWNIEWTQGLIWGFRPGSTATWSITDLENDQITASGVIWGGGGSRRTKSTSTVDLLDTFWQVDGESSGADFCTQCR